jgi:hypothetical protein
MNARIEEWRRWCHEDIRPDVYQLHLHRFIAAELTAMTESRGLPASYFFTFATQTYATSQAVMVRRQADKSRGVHSLAKLLGQMAEHPTEITRDFYVSEWGKDDARRANTTFDELAGVGVDHIPRASTRKTLTELVEGAAAVTAYVNEHVAHKHPEPTAEIPTFTELNATIDVIGEMYQRCNRLLYPGNEYGSLVPEIVDHDWKAVFREPWIVEEDGTNG